MIIDRKLRIWRLLGLSKWYVLAMVIHASFVVICFEIFQMRWMRLPWPVLTVIGTAVAFYIGFKNNSSYDRQWEARKIWGGIVNSSRSWGIAVKDFVTDQFTDQKVDASKLSSIHRELFYRHIAWLYCLRRQLWALKPWEHSRPGDETHRQYYAKHFAETSLSDELQPFLTNEERDRVLKYRNPATQLIATQSSRLRELRTQHLIDDFRHVECSKLLIELYSLQGKCERIKNYPLPRQYANTSLIFVVIFLVLLPFGVVAEFHELGGENAMGGLITWLTVPSTLLVGWVYWLMEIVGDYAENPFAGLALDTPMTQLCRTIEIDMREMLGEQDLPISIADVDGVVL